MLKFEIMTNKAKSKYLENVLVGNANAMQFDPI